MKTKLLKKLRKRFIIEGRNGKYKIVILDYKYNDQTPFYMSLEEAIDRRRNDILRFARINYEIPK